MITQEDQNRALDLIEHGTTENEDGGYSPMITDAARRMMAASKPIVNKRNMLSAVWSLTCALRWEFKPVAKERNMLIETIENLISLVLWVILLYSFWLIVR